MGFLLKGSLIIGGIQRLEMTPLLQLGAAMVKKNCPKNTIVAADDAFRYGYQLGGG